MAKKKKLRSNINGRVNPIYNCHHHKVEDPSGSQHPALPTDMSTWNPTAVSLVSSAPILPDTPRNRSEDSSRQNSPDSEDDEEMMTSEEHRTAFQSILLAVHQERQDYYAPRLNALTERHYILIKQALDMGLIAQLFPSAPQSPQKAVQSQAQSMIPPSFLSLYKQEYSKQTSGGQPGSSQSYEIAGPGALTDASGAVGQIKSPGGSALVGVEKKEKIHFIQAFKEKFCDSEVDLRNAFSDHICSKEGSKFVQENLSKASQEDITFMYQVVYSNLFSFSCHFYGNYAVQKVLEHCLQRERSEIFFKLVTDVKMIASNKHGTRVVQFLLQDMASYEVTMLADKMLVDLVAWVTSPFSCHIVLRMVEKLTNINSKELPKFVESIEKNMSVLINDSNAVKVILKVVHCCPAWLRDCVKEELFRRLLRSPIMISSDKSYILWLELYENGSEQEKKFIHGICSGSAVEVSCTPWGSLIIHTIFNHGSKEEIKGLVEILQVPANLAKLTANTHGIQTLQKMVYVIGVSDMATLFVELYKLKDIPSELEKTLLASVLKSAREENIIEVSSDFLSGGRQYPVCAQFGIGFDKLRVWMFSVFKNEPLGIEVKDLPLFILSLMEVAIDKDNPGLCVMKLNLQKFLVDALHTFTPSIKQTKNI